MSLPAYWQQSKEFLTHADPKLAKLILEHQQYSISSRGEALETLLRSIVGQQISVQAAASVWGKLEKKIGKIKPNKIGRLQAMQRCFLKSGHVRIIFNVPSLSVVFSYHVGCIK